MSVDVILKIRLSTETSVMMTVNTRLNSDKANEVVQFCTGCILLRVTWSLKTLKLPFLTAEFPGYPRLPAVESTEK